MPFGFFSRLIIRILSLPDVNCEVIWKDGIEVVYKDKHHCLLEYSQSSYELSLNVQIDNERANFLVNVIQAIDSLIHIFYLNMSSKMEKLIPCTHCISKRKKDFEPSIFPYEKVVEAFIEGKKMVHCGGVLPVEITELAPGRESIFSFLSFLGSQIFVLRTFQF